MVIQFSNDDALKAWVQHQIGGCLSWIMKLLIRMGIHFLI